MTHSNIGTQKIYVQKFPWAQCMQSYWNFPRPALKTNFHEIIDYHDKAQEIYTRT